MKLKTDTGIDGSHWNRGIKIANLDPLPRFAIFKATESDWYQDDTTIDFANQMRALGIPLGFYHFWQNVNATRQVDNYLKQVQAAGGFERIPPVLDLEVNLTGQANNVKLWLDAIESRTSRRPILYGNKGIFDTLGNPAWFKEYDIWTASYPDNPDDWNWVPPKYAETRGRREVMWQYACTYNYPAYPKIDLDVDIAIPEFLKEIGAVITPPDGGKPMAYGKAQEAQGKSASIRLAPDISGAKVGTLSIGVTIDFMELVPGSKVTTDKWLKLPNGIHYVNQYVGGLTYFKILSMPTPVEPPPTDPPVPTKSPVVNASMDFDLVEKTMTVTKRRQDGTVETGTDPIA